MSAAPSASRSALLQSLLLAATALFLLNFDPFESPGISKRLSQDLVYANLGDQSWLYPRERSHPPVVVIIVDEKALALRAAHWPAPLWFHTEFLSELQVLRPRAIMLDFLLLDRASPADTCALLGVADELASGGTRLYVAVTRAEDVQVLSPAGCRNAAGQPLQGDRLLTPVAVGRLADRSDFVNRLYPLDSGLPSAAVRMYCDGNAQPDACLRRLTQARPPGAGFDLAWAPSGDPFNARWSREACQSTPLTPRLIVERLRLPPANPCPPLPTLFASALMSPGEDTSLGERNEGLFSLIEGSFVFVGGNFRGSGDLVMTPMHALLPGVYYHAVALENLMAFNGEPKIRREFRGHPALFYLFDLTVLWILAGVYLVRERMVVRLAADEVPPAPLDMSTDARAWLEGLLSQVPASVRVLAAAGVMLLLAVHKPLQLDALVLTAIALVGLELRIGRRADLRRRMRCLGIYLAALAVSVLIIVSSIWIGYRWLRMPPGDWIGYLSFAAVGFFVTNTGLLEFERRIGAGQARLPQGQSAG